MIRVAASARALEGLGADSLDDMLGELAGTLNLLYVGRRPWHEGPGGGLGDPLR